MKYPTGEVVQIGDSVMLWKGNHGTVVALFDEAIFSENFPKSEWDYLRHGILVETEQGGLVHCLHSDKELKLIGRKGQTR